MINHKPSFVEYIICIIAVVCLVAVGIERLQAQTTIEYNRADWPHWIDADGDCQNTRAEILIEANQGVIGWKTTKKCQVVTGYWTCPYTGQTFTQASDLDIDHVVPLKWAHEHGGDKWDKATRRAFANDPLNLLAVDDGTNQSKGSKGPSDWIPEWRYFRAEYFQRWGLIVRKYDLR